MGWWLNTDFLRRRNPASWDRSQRRRQASPKGKSLFQLWKWGILLLIALCLAFSLIETGLIKYNKEVSSLEGELFPASEPDPQPCVHQDEKYMVYFPEPNLAVTASRLPLTIFRSISDGKRVAWIDKKEDGSLALSIDIRSDDSKLIVRMEKNSYVVNHSNYLQIYRRNDARDRSTLSVTDQSGEEVLKVKFLNPHVFAISADMKVQGRELKTSKLKILNGCLAIQKGPEGAGALDF